MIRVLGIAGSPRRHGNTETLLDEFLAGARQAGGVTEKVVVVQLEIVGCRNCDGCWQDGQCIVADDFQAVRQQILAADVIALAAPLFFWNLPAQTKALIDRSQCQWAWRFVLKRPLTPTPAGHLRRRGVFLCVGGDPRRRFVGAIQTVRDFFGVYGVGYWADLLYTGLDARDDAAGRPDVLQAAFALGERAVTAPWDHQEEGGT